MRLSSLKTPVDFTTHAKINGIKFPLKVANLSTNPEAMRMMDKQQREMMDGKKMKSISDVMPDFADKESSDITFGNMAVLGWKLSQADVAHLDFDSALANGGVWKEYEIGQAEPLKVKVRSANTAEMRELAYGFNLRALQGVDLRGAPIPTLEKQLWTKANRLQRLIVDWNVTDDEGKKQPINEESLMALVRVAIEVTNDIISDAEDDTNFCVAANKNPEELAVLAKTDYPFSADNREHLVRHCIPLRDYVLNLSRDETKARQAVAAETAGK